MYISDVWGYTVATWSRADQVECLKYAAAFWTKPVSDNYGVYGPNISNVSNQACQLLAEANPK